MLCSRHFRDRRAVQVVQAAPARSQEVPESVAEQRRRHQNGQAQQPQQKQLALFRQRRHQEGEISS